MPVKTTYFLVLIAIVAQLIAAGVCGPYSCEWGNSLYFFTGLGSLLLMVVMFLMQKRWNVIKRLIYAAVFSFLSVAVWVLGFAMGEFQLLCKLF